MRQRGTNSLAEGQQPLLVEKAVQAGVTLTTLADETSQSEGVELARVASELIHLTHVQLHRAVVLGRDEPVRGRALARQVEVDNPSLLVLHLAEVLHAVWAG